MSEGVILMFKLFKYLKLYKKEVIIGPIVKLTEAVFELIVPIIMARLIDNGVNMNDKEYIIKMGIILFILGFSGLCFALTCQYFASKASQGIGTALRNDLFRHINALSAREIDKIGTSSLITRLNSDVNQLQLCVAMLIRLAIRAPFLIIGSTIAAMIIDLKLSIILICASPLLAFVLYVIMKHSVPLFKSIQKKLDKISLITNESLSGSRVIRAFSKKDFEKERFASSANDLAETSMTAGRITALLNPLTFIIMNVAIIFIIYFGSHRVYTGDFTQGKMIAFVSYMTQIMLTMIVLSNLILIFTKGAASASRVNEIFDLESSVVEGKGVAESKNFENIIEFKNVVFSYNRDSDSVLDNINFTVKKGEKIGIIGGTGSGKSTLVNLITRVYDVDSGEILLKDNNIKDYTFSQLRSTVLTVPQKSVLFSGSLRENLKLGNKYLTDDELFNAIEIAQAKEFVSKLPEGLNTYIERNGSNLSGGQRQRLAIARAVAPKSEILILDDSSSALDFTTEANLRKALNKELSDTTIITTSQRIGCIMHCDKIIVIDDGKIVGIGNNSDLLENCVVYREIYDSQIKETGAI